ncbi:transglutaminase-like domain-containing protein [uncultured Sphaerochaeta sp.]|uniref:transglutaminase-like domain-containing protein n=1 Tax=uncultured Sphaerochaeta sp. TaxID=886478 RepID=UPI002A0A8968|nr:transglutaminase-like domain-containing protein [uncultured Sphaerochaeta sp.]
MEISTENEQQQATYLDPTTLLDFESLPIQKLVHKREWLSITSKSELIEAVYNFVRDEIPYGFNNKLNLTASQILAEGYGQCITKTTLLMALFRAVSIPCRFHGFTIDKVVQRGILKGIGYKLTPGQIYHSWVEIQFNNSWIKLEGHIVDRPYLDKLRGMFPNYMGSFYAYGIAVLNFKNPPIHWMEEHTYIQKQAIERDLGIFDSPDSFFTKYPGATAREKSLVYRQFVQTSINKNIQKIRET